MSTLMQNQPMVTKEELRLEFSKRLNEACDKAGVRSRGRAVDIQKQLKHQKISVTTTAIGKWLNGEAVPEQDKLLPLASWLSVSPSWLEYGEGYTTSGSALLAQESHQAYSPSKNDYALINQYSAVGECGGGYLNDHVELRDGLAFKRDWLARIGAKAENLAVIYASGDSMEPYIFDGDVVLFDTSDTEPKHGQVFVVRRPDYSLSIKRLVLQLSGDWLIKSDNADRTDEKVSSDTISEIPFVGRVIWRGGNIS